MAIYDNYRKTNDEKKELDSIKADLLTLKEDSEQFHQLKKALWIGEWNSGDINVPDTNKYSLFAISLKGHASVILAYKYSKYIRGIGCNPSENDRMVTLHFAATVNGNTWSFVRCNATEHVEADLQFGFIDQIVTSITGIV